MTAEPAVGGGPVQFVTFVVAEHLFGVEAASVLEVLGQQNIAQVPRAPAAVAGLMNLRGEVVTVIDVRRRFGFADRAEGAESMNVIVSTGDGASSLLVDAIGDVVEVPEDSIEEPPITLPGPLRALIRAACQLEGRLLLPLDVAAVIDQRIESLHDLPRRGAVPS